MSIAKCFSVSYKANRKKHWLPRPRHTALSALWESKWSRLEHWLGSFTNILAGKAVHTWIFQLFS